MRNRPDQLGLQRRAELCALATDDVGDRQRVARVGLAGALAVTLAVRAPSRDVEHLMPGGRQRPGQTAAVAARTLDTDHRRGGIAFGQPADQPPIARRTVGEGENAQLAAALVKQRRGVGVLVHVDADKHR